MLVRRLAWTRSAVRGDDVGRRRGCRCTGRSGCAASRSPPPSVSPATPVSGDQPARRREAERPGSPGRRRPSVAPPSTVARWRSGSTGHAAHRREVEHDPALADRMAGDVVAAAADRDREAVLTGERRRARDHVGDPVAPDDDRRAAVDHGVPDARGPRRSRRRRPEDLPANGRPAGRRSVPAGDRRRGPRVPSLDWIVIADLARWLAWWQCPTRHAMLLETDLSKTGRMCHDVSTQDRSHRAGRSHGSPCLPRPRPPRRSCTGCTTCSRRSARSTRT